MPAREKGGTSDEAATPRERTRPLACSRETLSVRDTGCPVPSRMARASSTDMTAPNGRMRLGVMSARQLADEMAELGYQQLGHRQTDGIFRPGERHDNFPHRRTGARAAQHR